MNWAQAASLRQRVQLSGRLTLANSESLPKCVAQACASGGNIKY